MDEVKLISFSLPTIVKKKTKSFSYRRSTVNSSLSHFHPIASLEGVGLQCDYDCLSQRMTKRMEAISYDQNLNSSQSDISTQTEATEWMIRWARCGKNKRHLSSFLRRNFLLISDDVWLVAFCRVFLSFHKQNERREREYQSTCQMTFSLSRQTFFLQRLSLPHRRCCLPPGFAIISSRLDDWNVCNSLFRSANMANNIFSPCWICCATRKKMCLHLQSSKNDDNFLVQIKQSTDLRCFWHFWSRRRNDFKGEHEINASAEMKTSARRQHPACMRVSTRVR